MTLRMSKPSQVAAATDADLQPASAEHGVAIDPKVAERLARLEADKELVLRLGLLGFAGPEWERFVEVLAQYAIQVFRSWLRTGKVFVECRHKPVRRFSDADDIDEVTLEIVAAAIKAFREVVLIPGKWDASKGASLRTFFVGMCKLQFSNIYRRWLGETRRMPLQPERLAAELEHQRAPSIPVHVAVELRRQHTMLLGDTLERIHALGAMGYTKAQIAEIDGKTEGAVGARLYRAREKMKR